MLNRTVADAALIRAVERDRQTFAIGTHLDRELKTRAVRLRSRSRDFCCWIDIQQQVFVNDEGHLTTRHSFYAISDSENGEPFFHYDYQREKPGYAEAHLQVLGTNAGLDAMMVALCTRREKKSMGELHFPVGGRRFRPTLEDLVEFLIDEQLADGKAGCADVISEARARFWDTQLRAAVRDNPDAAGEALRVLGYEVTAPKPSALRRLRGKRRTR